MPKNAKPSTASPEASAIAQAIEERRRESRRPAQGEVQLLIEDPLPLRIDGALVDVSESGFRAAHRAANLHSGQIVRFRHPWAQGVARIVWTRVIEDQAETGFHVIRI